MLNDCSLTAKENLGLSRCNALPALIKGMITTPEDFFLTPTEAVDADEWQDALLAGINTRAYFWPPFVSFENLSVPAVYEETPLAYLAVRDGNYRFRFGIKQNLCLHKAMYSHRANSGRVFLVDVENHIIGTEDEDGNFRGFTLQMLHTEKLLFSDGTVSTKSPIVVALADNLEMDANGAMVDGPFLNTIARLTDVTLTQVGALGANSFQFDVKQSCDNTPVSGLVLADVTFVKADGSAQTTPATALAESTTVPGRYTISKVGGTAWVAGLLDLVAPSALSIEAYESTGAASIA
jgi:hypothetical protein